MSTKITISSADNFTLHQDLLEPGKVFVTIARVEEFNVTQSEVTIGISPTLLSQISESWFLHRDRYDPNAFGGEFDTFLEELGQELSAQSPISQESGGDPHYGPVFSLDNMQNTDPPRDGEEG